MPTALKLLRGTARKSEVEAAPQPDAGIPECPSHLDEVARAEWDRLVPDLARLGLLSRIDRAALGAYCQLYSTWAEAQRFVSEHGTVLVCRTDKGEVKSVQASPHLSICFRALKEMRGYLSEFGLSPSSRARLRVEPQAESDEDARFFASRPPRNSA